MQQLDKNMSNLQTWLSRVEAELGEPAAYEVCHADEIQRKLAEQQVESRLRPRVRVETFVVGNGEKKTLRRQRAQRLILKVQTALHPRRSGAEPLGCGVRPVRPVMAAQNATAYRAKRRAGGRKWPLLLMLSPGLKPPNRRGEGEKG